MTADAAAGQTRQLRLVEGLSRTQTVQYAGPFGDLNPLAESIVEYGARFAAQVWPGDTLTATACIDSVSTADCVQLLDLTVTTLNQRGDPVLAGSAKVRLDSGRSGNRWES